MMGFLKWVDIFRFYIHGTMQCHLVHNLPKIVQRQLESNNILRFEIMNNGECDMLNKKQTTNASRQSIQFNKRINLQFFS